MKIPFGTPLLGEEERNAVQAVLSGPILVHGQVAENFEAAFATFTGSKEAISVSSCTAGMHLLYHALGIGPGDEVIVPAQTHVATGHAVELTGARAVFVDSELETGGIDVTAIEASISSCTKAIAVVHYLGVPVDMPYVTEIARQHNLFLLEDCALGLGAFLDGKHVGLHGDAGVFSFYPVKHITTAEGGMIILKNGELADRLRRLKAFGVDRNHGERAIPGLYDTVDLGFNYRMSELHAAIGVEQLKKLPSFLKQRCRNHKMLSELLEDIDKISVMPQKNDSRFQSAHYCLNISLEKGLAGLRPEIMAALGNAGVGCSIYYPHPVPRMSWYRKKYEYRNNTYQNAAEISDNSIALPIGPHVTEAGLQHIAKSLKTSLKKV
jgi:perosamine synthetase